MKKIITILMVLVCSIMFFGCDNEENKFWEKSSADWQTFSQDEKYLPFLDKDIEIPYKNGETDISSVLKSNEEYEKLVVNYESLLDITMEIVSDFANKFSIRPSETSKQIQNLYENFDKNLVELKTEIDRYISKDLASRVSESDLNTNNSKQHLIEAKTIFRNILTVANKCKNTAIEIYNKTLKENISENVESVSASAMKYSKIQEISYLIDAQIEYLKCFEVLEEKYYHTNLLEKIQNKFAEIESLTEVSLQTYNNQEKYNERLYQETQQFILSLEKVNIQEYFENVEYLNDKQTLKTYVEKILYYINI